jgi:hypothetical protein
MHKERRRPDATIRFPFWEPFSYHTKFRPTMLRVPESPTFAANSTSWTESGPPMPILPGLDSLTGAESTVTKRHA